MDIECIYPERTRQTNKRPAPGESGARRRRMGACLPKTGAESVISINRPAALKKMSNAREPATAMKHLTGRGKWYTDVP